MLELSVQTGQHSEFLDVTGRVQQAVDELGVRSGAVVVFNPHTTAAVTINEGADPNVVRDLTVALERLVPWQGDYRHAEGNSAAHVKASLLGSSVTVLVQDGRLRLGTWQKIYFCEFDGPRSRRLWIQVAGRD